MQASYAYGKLPAQDTERARRFYEEKLGLRPFGERNHHLYYEVGKVRFVVFPSSGTPSGTHDQLGLVVDDLEGAMAEMRSKGIVFENYPGLTENSVATFGPMKAAWFKDSEGNLLSLAEQPTISKESVICPQRAGKRSGSWGTRSPSRPTASATG
jgi:catechol 2,3-dioxygenase-like lactoylglutathione lyase family enzyme